jgi:hypothetical protein
VHLEFFRVVRDLRFFRVFRWFKSLQVFFISFA